MIPLRDDQPTFSTPFVNYFLIILNVLIFLWEYSLGVQSHRALNSFIGEFGIVPQHTIEVLTGHSYDGLATAIVPLFTSMFLHANIWHVAGNMLFLWIFGDNVEDYIGHFNYLAFYLISGLAAGAAHILVNQGSDVPSIGASGAIAGVMGAYLILYPKARVLVWFPPIFLFHVPAWIMLGYWFVVQFVSGTTTAIAETSQSSGGIAFWAHIGGFVAGVVMINLFRERSHRYRYGTW
ncbi:MAG TPA: rhomboid family intramembrane serine protease [Terriglobales bacterium]|nr:rhomboid family intramembrane serine protease [Terriglobales bacterium]